MKGKAPLSFLLMLMILLNCSEDDTIQPSEVSDAITNGEWKVSYFMDSDLEQTNDFAGYKFTFIETNVNTPGQGVVTVTNGSTDLSGTWKTDYGSSSAKLILSFTIDPFKDLSQDWVVNEKTTELIKMSHENGGNGGSDLLTLEKVL
jgi:hypothetical protein